MNMLEAGKELNQILQIATATLVLFTSLVLAGHIRSGKHIWVGIGFTLSVFCYILFNPISEKESLLRVLLLTGSLSVPVFLWILTRAIFEDHFRFTPALLAWFAVQLVPHIHHYVNCSPLLPGYFIPILDAITQITSLGFVLAAMYVALKTKKEDLIETRLQFRNSFISISALLITLTLLLEATHFAIEMKDWLQIFQRLAILGLTTYFLLSNFVFKPGFFFQDMPKSKTSIHYDTALEEQLMNMLHEKKIYRTEGLTIVRLAETMGVQEHRLRKLINVQLDFKNFNDFLNQYRVQEAAAILSDPAQNNKTILEIAYALGYQSIGPFNKAFKEQKNTTPTAFRKAQQG